MNGVQVMDICMLLPSQRAELQKLLGEYNQIRKRIEEFLLQIEIEWGEEIRNVPSMDTIEHDDRMYFATERLATVMQWIEIFHDREVEIEDVEEWE
jgi:hypothetical protein